MTLIQEPVGLSLSAEDLAQMFDREVPCTYAGEEGGPEEVCPREATHRVHNHTCGHVETMCKFHAYECKADGILCDCGATDWTPEVFPL